MKQNLCDYILGFLANQGIEEIFEVYGSANANLIDAFTRTDKIRYVAVMHEQAAGFAAEGHAKVSRKPGVVIATSGPGAMNLVTPIGNCFYDSVPCLFLTGQIKLEFIRPDPSIRQVGFQETDVVSIVSSITKYAKQIRKADDIKYELEKAWYLAQDGRPGPVLLDLPIDIQKQEVDPDKLHGFQPEIAATSYNSNILNQQINLLFNDLEKSKRPVILVGGGVWTANAVNELLAVGKELAIPVLPTFNALDVVTSDYEFFGGRVGTNGSRSGNFTLQNSDLLLAIGSRISGRITGGNLATFARNAKKYVVDIDPALLQRKLQQVPFDINIRCDAKTFLHVFRSRLLSVSSLLHRPINDPLDQWMEKVKEWKRKYHPTTEKHYKQKTDTVNPYVFLKKLSEQMQSKDIFVYDCGGNVIITNSIFETKRGQRLITNNGNSPMGFSFAGAMGAWFASDKIQNVVCLIGDGGFNMNIQEIQTCLNYGIGIKVIILNNHIYGITKSFQKTNFGGRMEGCGPKGYNPPDFRKVIGLGYGAPTMTVDDNEEIDSKIQEFLNTNGLIFMDVNCHDWHTYGPKIIGWSTPIEDMYPYLPREEFRKEMIVDPVPDWENPFMPSII